MSLTEPQLSVDIPISDITSEHGDLPIRCFIVYIGLIKAQEMVWNKHK